MNKPVYLGLSILELNKILMYEFWYDYVNPKYRGKAKKCGFIFIVYIFFHCIHKNRYFQMIFTNILQKSLKLDLILQIMN